MRIPLFLKNDGKVGIGTNNPGFDLDVQDATANLQVKSTTGANIAYANFCNTGGNVYVGQDNSGGGGLAVGTSAYAAVFGHVGAHPVQFITDETPRMTILHSSGYVGIGTTSPDSQLHVSHGTWSTLRLTGGGTAGGQLFGWYYW